MLLRKLGAKFSEADRDDLFQLMDSSNEGVVIFRDFCSSLKEAEKDPNHRFGFYKCAPAFLPRAPLARCPLLTAAQQRCRSGKYDILRANIHRA